VQDCIDAGLVSGETVHVDATLIRADVSWKSMAADHADKVPAENAEQAENVPAQNAGQPAGTPTADQPQPHASAKPGRPRKKPKSPKKHSSTDPIATMSTSQNNRHLEPAYKQHTATDDKARIILGVATTTGEANEGQQLPRTVERVETATGKKIGHLTGDSSYARAANYYQYLEARGTEAIIPPQRVPRHAKKLPARRFKYDPKHSIVRCPAGKVMQQSSRTEKGWLYRARACDCRQCPLRQRCVPRTAKARTIHIVDGYEALLRARRERYRWDDATKDRYRRHRWIVEGVHGEAKTQHGLRRAVRRGLDNVAIQVYLTATAMNLKRLAAFLLHLRADDGAYDGKHDEQNDNDDEAAHVHLTISPLAGRGKATSVRYLRRFCNSTGAI